MKFAWIIGSSVPLLMMGTRHPRARSETALFTSGLLVFGVAALLAGKRPLRKK